MAQACSPSGMVMPSQAPREPIDLLVAAIRVLKAVQTIKLKQLPMPVKDITCFQVCCHAAPRSELCHFPKNTVRYPNSFYVTYPPFPQQWIPAVPHGTPAILNTPPLPHGTGHWVCYTVRQKEGWLFHRSWWGPFITPGAQCCGGDGRLFYDG